MGFYLHRIPSLVQKVCSNHLWKLQDSENKIYLTFDDGPTKEVTDYVLDILSEHSAQATFFWLGENVEDQVSLVKKARNEGHQIANHGYAHLDGWKISKKEYIANAQKGEEVLRGLVDVETIRFRPPYGHFRGKSNVVLWSLMSGDFDTELTKEKCLSRLVSKTRSGDIIVFHDNEKSFEKLKWVLPKYLTHCIDMGFQFDLIPMRI